MTGHLTHHMISYPIWCHKSWQCPLFRAKPTEAEKKEKEKEYTCKEETYSHPLSNGPNFKMMLSTRLLENTHATYMAWWYNTFSTTTLHNFAVIKWEMQKFLCWWWRGVKIQFNHSMDHTTLHVKHRAIFISLIPKMHPCIYAFYSASFQSNPSSA